MLVEPRIAAAAFLQVAEVRRRTGDLAGADEGYTRAHELGEDPQPGLALLRLAQGRIDAAASGIEVSIEGESRPAQLLPLLAAQVEIALARGDLETADLAAQRIDEVAREIGTSASLATAAGALGSVALERGDASAALTRLRAATAAWQELGIPHESARARVAYARALRASGDGEGAELELRAALGVFERLGAVPDADAVRRSLDPAGTLPNGLTAREAEVLRLVASGKTNRDIAVELVISEHTVSRHLQNMYAKLGVSSRAAATAFAFEHGLT
jgi:DNA-binding CsgD family transcriptional regulator